MLGAVGNRRQMNEPVGRPANRLQHHLRIAERSSRQQFARLWPLRLGHHGRHPAARLRRAKPLGMRRRDRRAHRQREPQRLGDACHGRGGAHHHAGADGGRKPAVDGFDFNVVNFAGAIFSPQPPGNPRARPQHLALAMPDHHRPDGNDDGGRSALTAAMICAGKVLSHPPITTTASMGCARIISSVSIAIKLRRYIEVGCEKLSAIQMVGNTIGMAPHHAALHRLDDLRNVAVTGIVVAVGIGDADDRPVQRITRITHRLDEGLAQKQREASVAITCQSLAKSVGHSRPSFGPSSVSRHPSPRQIVNNTGRKARSLGQISDQSHILFQQRPEAQSCDDQRVPGRGKRMFTSSAKIGLALGGRDHVVVRDRRVREVDRGVRVRVVGNEPGGTSPSSGPRRARGTCSRPRTSARSTPPARRCPRRSRGRTPSASGTAGGRRPRRRRRSAPSGRPLARPRLGAPVPAG